MTDAVYDLTLERIALIRRMVVAWNGAEPGAPMIHPEAPYGSRDRDGDIANVTGDDDGAEEEHRALEDGLAVFSQNARLKPGRYQYHNPLAKLDCAAITDVFPGFRHGRDPGAHHLRGDGGASRADPAAQPHVGRRSRRAADRPGAALRRERRPTRSTWAGIWAAADEDSLVRLHREMQPAFQIFLRYADLGPGTFRRNAASVWEPA